MLQTPAKLLTLGDFLKLLEPGSEYVDGKCFSGCI
jgi:hypothetical protein